MYRFVLVCTQSGYPKSLSVQQVSRRARHCGSAAAGFLRRPSVPRRGSLIFARFFDFPAHPGAAKPFVEGHAHCSRTIPAMYNSEENHVLGPVLVLATHPSPTQRMTATLTTDELSGAPAHPGVRKTQSQTLEFTRFSRFPGAPPVFAAPPENTSLQFMVNAPPARGLQRR